MSSTSNVQNLLTNVFRPIFVYDTTNGVYQSKLELTNIDAVSANIVYTFAAAVGDANGNVYVGVGAGNAHSILSTTANSNDTFLGTGAGGSTSNVRNGVFIGYRAGFGAILASNSISIGANTLNGGNSNIYIGCGTGIASGSNNIFLGPGVTNGGTSVSNCLLIGSGSNTSIIGDLSSNRIGINLTSLPATTPDLKLDVNGFARIGTNATGGLGINTMPGYYALDVNGNFRVSDGYGTFTMSNSGTNCVASISNTSGYAATSIATLQVTGGFFSFNGTTGSISTGATSNIGILKKGSIMINVQSTTSTGTYAIIICTAFIVSSTFSVAYTTSNVSGGINVYESGSNIVLYNNTGSSGAYTYSITYFPLP